MKQTTLILNDLAKSFIYKFCTKMNVQNTIIKGLMHSVY